MAVKHWPWKEGEVIAVRYPFVRATTELMDFDSEGISHATVPTWNPGVRNEWIGPESTFPFADGIGEMRLTVVAIFKPGKYPTRVFFTRQFTSPAGVVFGKGKLHIVTTEKFARLASGFAVEYDVAKAEAVS